MYINGYVGDVFLYVFVTINNRIWQFHDSINQRYRCVRHSNVVSISSKTFSAPVQQTHVTHILLYRFALGYFFCHSCYC